MKYTPPSSAEEKLFTAKIADLIKTSQRRGSAEFSCFLNLRERELALQTASRFDVETRVFGGCEGSERVMLRVTPCGGEEKEFPIVALGFEVFGEFDHRDVLGSVLGLGLSREPIGDIAVFENGFCIFVTEKIADFLRDELKRIGKMPCRFSEKLGNRQMQARFSEESGTVSSPRLDAVVAELSSVSRAEASSLIEKGFVTVNHMTVQKPSFEIEEKDILSVRTKGKYKINDLSGVSRKGRVIIKYSKYL